MNDNVANVRDKRFHENDNRDLKHDPIESLHDENDRRVSSTSKNVQQSTRSKKKGVPSLRYGIMD